jgi:hypothetical protein
MAADFAGVYAKLDRADAHLTELRTHPLAHMSRPNLTTGAVEYNPTTRTLDQSRIRRKALPAIRLGQLSERVAIPRPRLRDQVGRHHRSVSFFLHLLRSHHV